MQAARIVSLQNTLCRHAKYSHLDIKTAQLPLILLPEKQREKTRARKQGQSQIS